MQKNIVEQAFLAHFQQQPALTVSSPGRINLIGEHTDYNNGFVLPAAIDKAVGLSISPRTDDEIHLYSIDKNESFATSLHSLTSSPLFWPDYLLGVVDEFQKHGHKMKGFNAALTGDIPLGAGLSSSAAVECATAFALNELFQLGIDRVTMVKLSQKAENNFVGVKCGIMDQFASMMGKQGNVIKLDCGSLEYEYFPLEMKGFKVVLLDTQVKHSLASSEYNTRREECAEGVALIAKKYPEVKSLRDATLAQVNECIPEGLVRNRCTYVVEEIQRLLDGCEDLQAGRVNDFGKKMFATHDGLSKLYEVSCKELDFIANACKQEPGVIGARMMGGGFGGCVIALIKDESVSDVIAKIDEAYSKNMKLQMKAYVTSIDNGTSLLS